MSLRAALLAACAACALAACSGVPGGSATLAGATRLSATDAATASPASSPSSTAAASPTSSLAAAASATSSARSGPTSGPSTSAAARAPAAARFRWTAGKITTKQLGASWRRGCPVGPAGLRAVTLTYWDFTGTVRTGVLVLHRDVVTRTRPVFAAMFARRFPIRSVRPVSVFRGSDDRSMAADNTSGFNCRLAVAAGPPTWSRHAFGRAIDVNPVQNPYLFRGKVLPPKGKAFRDRSRARPGMIRRGDRIHRAFERAGYRWGGSFSNPDYQHFDR